MVLFQSVVPHDLLDQYLRMLDPSCAMAVDNEVTRHCAYSLPAVAYTLGRQHWPTLKSLFYALANDIQVSSRLYALVQIKQVNSD